MRLLDEAILAFKRVLQFDTSGRAEVRPIAQASLSSALATRAQREDLGNVAAKVALYREACSSYETAASAAPGDGELQLHWGETISEMLVLSASVPSEGTAAEMRTLFEAAEARFNEALKCPLTSTRRS